MTAALLALLLMLAGTAAAFLAPPILLAPLAALAFAAMRHGRRVFALVALTTLPLNVLIVGWSVSGPGLGPFSETGMLLGLFAGLRLLVALGANLAILSWIPPARILDGIPLPRRIHALLAAVLLAAHDLARDFERLKNARRMRGEWPANRLARAREAARLVPPLIVGAHERSLVRRDALRLAGVDVGRLFVPVVAIAALAAAGRLAFLALPNVALTYVVVFLGGLLFGPLVGILGAALGMALTDFLLTGLYPLGFVNVPAMALLGLAGGALRGTRLFDARTSADRAAVAMLAACIGIGGTLLFSIAVDTTTWFLVLRDAPETWRAIVLAGLAFNVIPALLNGALFAAATGPTVAAFRARQAPQAADLRPSTPQASAPDAPAPSEA